MQKQTQQDNILVGLDIGTTKVCVVAGELSGDGINIIGIGTYPSIGLRKGVVINIEATVTSIKKAVKEAETMAGCKISSAYASIAGSHITSFNSHGIIAINGAEITEDDLTRVINAARAVAIPIDREIIHVIPQEYIIDDQVGIQNPVGMTGIRLEVKIHVVTGAIISTRNIVKCANKAGLEVNGIVLESIASSEAVLTNEEKETGTALINIGGGTSDLAIFRHKNINHSFILALGGNNLTNDIAIGAQTSLKDAEKIKIKYGMLNNKNSTDEKQIELKEMENSNQKQVSHKILREILESRMEEIFYLIHKEICRTNMKNLISSGIVLSGGTSLLEGIISTAESVFGVPTRVGKPIGINDGLTEIANSPSYSTGIGLVIYGAKQIHEKKMKNKNFLIRLGSRIKKWIIEII